MSAAAPLLLGAALLVGAAQPPATETRAASDTAAARQCWPELRGSDTEKPGTAIGRMIRLQAGKSPVARFDEGDSLVVVVALPAFRKPYALEFQATPDINFGKPSEILWPSVVVVDADFCALEKLPELAFERHYSFFTGQTTTRADVPVRDGKPRYALVYSDATAVGTSVGLEVNGLDMADLRRSAQGYVMVRINR